MQLPSPEERIPASQLLTADPDQQLATVWPSGQIKHVLAAAVLAEYESGQADQPATDPDSQLYLDMPIGEAEQRRADVLTKWLRVSPALASVLERPDEQTEPNQPIRRRESTLPPGKRVVFVPIPKRLAA